MQLADIQMVLDRIVTIYSEISPQILRSSVEYAKQQAMSPSIDECDGSGGKNNLFARVQGYIEGYCRVFDGFYNADATDIASSEHTKKSIDKLLKDYGEEAPTSFLSACGDFLEILSVRACKESVDTSSDLFISNASGFMDGTLAADMDLSFDKYVKIMNTPYPMDEARKAYDIAAEEIELEIDDKEASDKIKQAACESLDDMMNLVIYPKSGNSEMETADPLACAMLYLAGYVKGIFDNAETAFDLDDICDLDDEHKLAMKLSESLLAMWTRYNGYSSDVLSHAKQAMRDNTLTEALFFENHSPDESEILMATLFGMGYSDGYWMRQKDDENPLAKAQMEISKEIDCIFRGIFID